MLLIQQGRLAEAKTCYEQALAVNTRLSDYAGAAITLFNLANLEAVKENVVEALNYAARAKGMQDKINADPGSCAELLRRLALAAMKQGMAHEKNGELEEALACYRASVPYAGEKNRRAMLQEIELIERVMRYGQGKDCPDPEKFKSAGHS